MSNEVKRAVRVLLLGVSVAGAGCYGYCRVEAIRGSFGTTYLAESQPGPISSTWQPAMGEMTRQNELLINWGVLLLGATAALVITTKAHPLPYIEWIYLCLPPAGAFLFGSLWAGVNFQRRLTYLVLKGSTALESLNALLLAQSDLFQWAIVFLGGLAVCFLWGIVWGSITPVEKKT